MKGAECLLRTLLANRVTLCLMNPGTSEMHFVTALDRAPEMRGVLCLFEGVCAGAADGYARMTGKPAATLLHLGPGLANGLANFHNARKARSPVVNIVGEHTAGHRHCGAPLAADIAAFANTVSGWVHTLDRAGEMGAAASAAIAAALSPPGQVATLIVPADHSWSEAGEPGPVVAPQRRSLPEAGILRDAARVLRSGEPAGLLLDGSALRRAGLAAAGRIASASGARVFAARFCARMERGRGLFPARRIPYFPEPAEAMLAGLKHLVLVESQPPVSFFGYPGRRSHLAPLDCSFQVLAREDEDGAAALEELAAVCGAGSGPPPVGPAPPPLPHGAALTPETIGQAIAALLPEGAILSDEALSSGEAVTAPLEAAPPHDHLPVTGGSIGQGLPVALGAALACPDRKVIALEADGSGMYTLQALWTMAREQCDVAAVILANRRYRILDLEVARTGAGSVGPRANDMIDIGRPPLDWVKLSEGLGVPASRATTADEFIAQFQLAVKERGPRLIEAMIA